MYLAKQTCNTLKVHSIRLLCPTNLARVNSRWIFAVEYGVVVEELEVWVLGWLTERLKNDVDLGISVLTSNNARYNHHYNHRIDFS